MKMEELSVESLAKDGNCKAFTPNVSVSFAFAESSVGNTMPAFACTPLSIRFFRTSQVNSMHIQLSRDFIMAIMVYNV
jgi:hypothetical protein